MSRLNALRGARRRRRRRPDRRARTPGCSRRAARAALSSCAERIRGTPRRWWRWCAALGLRVGVHGSHSGLRDRARRARHDVHARSIAGGDGFSERLTGKPTAFRPPGYPICWAAPTASSASKRRERSSTACALARTLGALLGLWCRVDRVAGRPIVGAHAGLVAMALAAVDVPSIRQPGDDVRASFVGSWRAARSVIDRRPVRPTRTRSCSSAVLLRRACVM